MSSRMRRDWELPPHTPTRTQHAHRTQHGSPSADGNFDFPSFHRYTTRTTSRSSRTQDVLRQVREPGHSRYHTSRHIFHPDSTPPREGCEGFDAGCGQSGSRPTTESSQVTSNSGQRQQPRDITLHEVQSMPIIPVTSTTVPPTLPAPATGSYVYFPPAPTAHRSEKGMIWWVSVPKDKLLELLRTGEHICAGAIATAVLVILVFRSDGPNHLYSAGNIAAVAIGSMLVAGYVIHQAVRFWGHGLVKKEEWVEMGVYVHHDALRQKHRGLFKNPFVRFATRDIRTMSNGNQIFDVARALEAGQLAIPQPALLRDHDRHSGNGHLSNNAHQGRRGYDNGEHVQNRAGPSQSNQPMHDGQTVGEGSISVVNEPLVQDWQLVQSPANTTQIGLAQTTSPYTTDAQRREFAQAHVESETATIQRLFDKAQAPVRAVGAESLAGSNSKGSSIQAHEQMSPVSLQRNEEGGEYFVVGSDESSRPSSASVRSCGSGVSDVVELVQPISNRDTMNSSPQASSAYSSEHSPTEEMSPSPEPYSPLSKRPVSQISQQPARPPLRSHTTIVTEVGTPESQKTGYRACSNRSANASSSKGRIRQLHEPTWSYTNEIQQLKSRETQEQQVQATPKGKAPAARVDTNQSFGYRRDVHMASTAAAAATTSHEMHSDTSNGNIGRSNTNGSAASSIRTSEEIRRHRAETLAILCGEPLPIRSPPRSQAPPSPSPSRSYGSLGRGGQLGQRPLPATPSRIYFRDGRHMTPITEKSEASSHRETFF
ncbi:hypothetical protein F5X99DRAFT_76479 [Biscogniauxia marginata]|nr:hypothetical protein F5X99DRAFT_76479 [Biscogniauxia marginata]